ncbi:MAG: integrase arm-type DNA-binding domain-containing protein [Candidatus Thiodiazotropha sp. (ex Lucina aurantia)]|nr:integrase arm-type DNA-binding domain-containing protein [Candidatus Thiodiazotropha taylori]MBV2097840.1 integrase arm-type DNA-binding domain-containing protein [Candidatus Thiodiazotropha sp. (ex Codakia orbicularis)]MBV2103287.1 integrase arm-type DNA-binding domain-containing protein [Candidatus Thiodiazotropha sp. (ex Lucina aurantia)]MBV2116350.1 integrase arm-type DNA-binding domain-containing protein [Candidatus Thiodiazotropha sp. (ex Lucina aurantia)]
MPTIKFVDSIIRNIKPPDKRQVLWCDGSPGFGLRVTPRGAKTFVYKYMSNRQSRWLTIGKYPEISLSDARIKYHQYYKQVNDYGRDPVYEREKETLKEKEDKERQITVSEFVKIYLEWERLKEKSSIDKEEGFFDRDLIPVIGSLSVSEVFPDHIEKIQMRILERSKTNSKATRGGKVAIKNGLAYTRQLFNFAKKKGLVKNNPVSDVDSLGVAGKRNRVLSLKEIWLFWNRIEIIGVPPVTANALKYALVTMQRSIEIRNMRYKSVKIDESVWQMEMQDTKNKTMHRVPLNNYAVEILNSVEPYTGNSPYVFGAVRSKNPPKKPKKSLVPYGESAFPQAIQKRRKELGIDDITPHDLRRTGATWITAVGLPKLYARLMLNHSDGDNDVTGEVYVQYSYDFEKRRAVNVWAFILDQIVNCKSIEDVPTLDELRNSFGNSSLA